MSALDVFLRVPRGQGDHGSNYKLHAAGVPHAELATMVTELEMEGHRVWVFRRFKNGRSKPIYKSPRP